MPGIAVGALQDQVLAQLGAFRAHVVVALHLQQMEQEQRRVGVGEGRVIGHRTGAGHPRVEFAQPHLLRILVDQEVELEIAAVALLSELLAEPEGEVAGLAAQLGSEGIGEDLVAGPTALVGGQLLEADDLGHQRPDDRPRLGGAGLDRRLPAADPLHDLDLALADDLLGVDDPRCA